MSIASSTSTAHFEGEMWMSRYIALLINQMNSCFRSDGHVSVLSCNEHGWLDYKNLFVNDDSFVTAVCLVGENHVSFLVLVKR